MIHILEDSTHKIESQPPQNWGHSASRLLYVYVTYNWMSQLISVGMLMLVIGRSRNVPWIVGFFPKWSSGIALCQKVWLIFFKSEKRNREREQHRSILWKSAFQSASKILSRARVCFKILFLLTMGWRHLKAVENHFWFSEFEEIFTYHSEKATAGLKHLICLICQS